MSNRRSRHYAIAVAAALMLAGAATAPPALTVRIDPSGDVPRLLVNEQPVRARMFWGGPGGATVPITPQWQEVTFDFIAKGSAGNGTMHFRFGKSPGNVFLDDIHVVDLDTGTSLIPVCNFENGYPDFTRDWTWWPTDATNTVGEIVVQRGAGHGGTSAMQVHLTAPPDGNWPDFHVHHLQNLSIAKGHHYRAAFWVRADTARDLVVAFYQPGATFTFLGGPPDPFASQIALAAGAGVDIVSFSMSLPWPQPGQPEDWSAVDAACETVLQVNPNALLLPRIGMTPPAWWSDAHPDDGMQREDGHRGSMVVASPQYRQDAAERLAALVTHLEATYGDHIAGYHPSGQNTGEWFYQDTWNRLLNGYAPADLVAWRLWLAGRYADDAALQSAWGDLAATRAAAAVPTPAAHHAAPAGVFRDPATERPLIDWAEFQQEAMADCVTTLAHAVREASQGRKLVMFFYGYIFEFAAVWQNDPATSGHYALRRVLDCPDIDVLCSPISYYDRGLGQGAPSMTAAESVTLAGKMWLNEDDTHTYLATGTPPGSADHVTTLEESNAELTRNVAQEALRNFATWWMDLGRTGWFNDPGMWAQMKRLAALDDPLLRNPT
ncbi:MAG: beta-galactosidase, partial [bacterium]|nr:beta-galactosidase [bacterium]